MIITVTDDDINNWIRLAQTNETMMDALMKCATVYALALPEHNKVVSDDTAGTQPDPNYLMLAQIAERSKSLL